MYELLIKEASASFGYSVSYNLTDLLIQFHKWAKTFGIAVIHQRVIFTRVKSNNYIILRIAYSNNSKSKIAKELYRFSKTNPEYKFYIRYLV